jgi:two-component system, sensor histidine kinase and response regulator
MTRASAKLRILVADDDPDLLETLAAILSSENAEVVAVADGRAAVHQALLTPFDVCILDVTMPNLDGYETCALLREMPLTRNVPIIFLTGRNDKESVDQAFAAGGSDYLCKPFHPLLLLQRMSNLLNLNRLTDEKAALTEILKSTPAPEDRS